MPGPFSDVESTLPTCPIFPLPEESYKRSLYSRFGNNNFAIHSHLTSFAHGIFPVASRLFNHSCIPNAAAKYIINRSQPIKMEVVALRDITKGEEVSPVSLGFLVRIPTDKSLCMFARFASRTWIRHCRRPGFRY